jgi:Xaa-Pro aminopeptidase
MMDSSLTSEFFKGNRDKLFKALKVDAVVISANGLLQKNADEPMPFRQDSNFWYLSGINEADLILVITKTEEYIILPTFALHRQKVTKPIDEKQIAKISGITQIVDEKTGWKKLIAAVPKKPKIAINTPNPVLLKFHGIYSNPARRRLQSSLKGRFPSVTLVDARRQLAAQRMLKQPVEIKLIQKALDITTDTLKDVLSGDLTKKYKIAGEIEQAIHLGFLSRGGEGHAFDPVVAAGENATHIHFPDLSQPLKINELIVCDVGSTYSFYCADITRTVSYGEPTARQLEVYEAVKFVQSEVFKIIRPGIIHKDYEKQVENMVGEQLKKLGLITSINRKSVRKYYNHYCSHSLGIDTHDSADYSLPLPENMVMAVEPGIYIPEEGIGVRIEDIVRITKDGCEIMSSDLPTRLKL